MSLPEGVTVRRVRADEWRRVRALRLEALADPDAAIAFLEDLASGKANPDAFWQERAAGGAEGDRVAQFVAVDGDEWIGTVAILVSEAGAADYQGHVVESRRANVVGVYLRPNRRGTGIIDALLDAAIEWTRDRGFEQLHLDVHSDNSRARAAYARAGFIASGVSFTGSIGPEIEMVRSLTAE